MLVTLRNAMRYVVALSLEKQLMNLLGYMEIVHKGYRDVIF
jgi:hypothetical protein